VRLPDKKADCDRVQWFLASEEAGFITGQIICADGGMSVGI
jgi:NAD(P)-dependent dehydrogenase (short-subunit alcohol dehydrogenase family)